MTTIRSVSYHVRYTALYGWFEHPMSYKTRAAALKVIRFMRTLDTHKDKRFAIRREETKTSVSYLDALP